MCIAGRSNGLKFIGRGERLPSVLMMVIGFTRLDDDGLFGAERRRERRLRQDEETRNGQRVFHSDLRGPEGPATSRTR